MKKFFLALLFAAAVNAMENKNDQSEPENSAHNLVKPIKISFLPGIPFDEHTKKSGRSKKKLSMPDKIIKSKPPSEEESESTKDNKFFTILEWHTDMNFSLSYDPEVFYLIDSNSCEDIYDLYSVNVDEQELNFVRKINDKEKLPIVCGPGNQFEDKLKQLESKSNHPDILKTISFDHGNRKLTFYKHELKVSISDSQGKILHEFQLLAKASSIDTTIFSNGDFALLQRVDHLKPYPGFDVVIYYGRNKIRFQEEYQFILDLAHASPDVIAQKLTGKDKIFFPWPMFQKLLGPINAEVSFANYPKLLPKSMPLTDQLSHVAATNLMESPTIINEQPYNDPIVLEENFPIKGKKLKPIARFISPLIKDKHTTDEHIPTSPLSKRNWDGFIENKANLNALNTADIFKFEDKALISLLPIAGYLSAKTWEMIDKKKLFMLDTQFRNLANQDNEINQPGQDKKLFTDTHVKKFFRAIAEFDLKTIQELVDKGIDFQQIKYKNFSPFQYAHEKKRDILVLPLLMWPIFDKEEIIKVYAGLKKEAKNLQKNPETIKKRQTVKRTSRRNVNFGEKNRHQIFNNPAGLNANLTISDWTLFSRLLFKNEQSVDIDQFKGTVFYWIWHKYKNDQKDPITLNEEKWLRTWKLIKAENLSNNISSFIDPTMLSRYLSSNISPLAHELDSAETAKLFKAVKLGNVDEIDGFVATGINLAQIKNRHNQTLSQYAVSKRQLFLELPLEDNLIWCSLFDRDKFKEMIKSAPLLDRHPVKANISSTNNLENSSEIKLPRDLFSPRNEGNDKDNQVTSKHE